jgi:hypothetical protein
MVFLRGPNYNSTKGCFAYFGVSPGKAIDKAKAFVLDYPNPSGTEQAENLLGDRAVVWRCGNRFSG